MMLGGLAALGLGLLILLTGSARRPAARPASAEQRILAYGTAAARGRAPEAVGRTAAEAAPALDQAKDAAAKMLDRNKGLEEQISQRLEAAGSALKPAEWLLLHGAMAMLGGLVGLLVGGGGISSSFLACSWAGCCPGSGWASSASRA